VVGVGVGVGAAALSVACGNVAARGSVVLLWA